MMSFSKAILVRERKKEFLLLLNLIKSIKGNFTITTIKALENFLPRILSTKDTLNRVSDMAKEKSIFQKQDLP